VRKVCQMRLLPELTLLNNNQQQLYRLAFLLKYIKLICKLDPHITGLQLHKKCTV